MRPQIVVRLREQAAEEKYRAKIRELDELAFETPDELTHVSETSGLPVQHVINVTQTAGAAPFDAPALRTAAFSDEVIGRGLNSRVIEVEKVAYVVRVKEHRPPVQRALADVADGIRKQLVREAATDRAREVAAEAMGRVAKGDATAEIASAYGLEWKVVPGASRGAPGVDQEIVKSAFGLPRPGAESRSVTSTELGGGNVAVVTVSAVKDGDYGGIDRDGSCVDSRSACATRRQRRVHGVVPDAA